MRWDAQSTAREAERSLPGLETERIRTFDAPEALDIRFHEVRAKSALNRVPGTYLPFNWTVNPFRGCSHACTYCLSGDTPILMGDGRTRPLAEIEVGDLIYGTVRRGNYRRYVTTDVKAHWSTVKPAYRVELEDGTGLVASGDHRFLTDRGWKHVSDGTSGWPQRPHLTTNNKMMGTGAIGDPPEHSADYRRGYLCGLIRGDGHVGSYSYPRRGRIRGDVHRFRLALTDIEPLFRARDYLAQVDVPTRTFQFQGGTGRQRPLTAIRTSAKDPVARTKEIVSWPRSPSLSWCKGFLAGIFDAEGSHSRGILRISNTDSEIIGWTADCLRRLGFSYALDRTPNPNGLTYVRLTGGLPKRLSFFQAVDPATGRKRSIEGTAIKSDAPLGVASIEPLGRDLELFDITTGTGDFIANGVVSHNCFARNTHTYLDLDAGRDFEREIVVKVNVPELLRAELSKPSWKHELVAFGTNTDPYQWAEGRYELMPPMLEALRDTRTPTSVLSKSSLPLRDLELYKQIAEVTDASVNFSIPTLEEKAWRETEPHTPHPRKRMEAVARFNEAGIPSGVLIAPLMPGINDSPEQVQEIVDLATEAGATFVNGIALHLRPGVREVFMSWLSAARPDLVPRYEELYARGAYAPPAERKRIAALVKAPNRSDDPRYRRSRRRADQARKRAAADRPPEQQSLF
ncbi:MAG: intein-containing Rv2578c family radical SAM protein [Actinomycetota bacterium]|nr:intein-containing Rv2578c family radical SAM protein [Actinomycetota bacterium]